MTELADTRIAIIGLGYVGLPLAVAFAEKYDVVGFDLSSKRIEELRSGKDRTLEVELAELQAATRLTYTVDPADIANCNVYIVTAPTPINRHKQPDLGPVLAASRTIGRVLSPGDTVVYESTVYPGATEEDCVPVLEEVSGLKLNVDFGVGYSPERVNPGDKEHRVTTILKVTSGSTPDTADYVDDLYGSIITAGTHKAPTIRVAEAAKVIENTQRDVNIALVNELAILFNKLDIDTGDVLAAAGTKWNFLNFRPGLVGGHCIGVDPYYLTHKAQEVGYHPEIILAGRRLNDSMGGHVADRLIKEMASRGIRIKGSRILVLGLTFKENTPDLRNTRVVDIIREVEKFGATVEVYDPWVDVDEARAMYNVAVTPTPPGGPFDAIVAAVAHNEFREWGLEGIRRIGNSDGFVVFDLKHQFQPDEVDLRL